MSFIIQLHIWNLGQFSFALANIHIYLFVLFRLSNFELPCLWAYDISSSKINFFFLNFFEDEKHEEEKENDDDDDDDEEKSRDQIYKHTINIVYEFIHYIMHVPSNVHARSVMQIYIMYS